MELRIKRIYESPDAADGWRVLVDRLWPRGMSKDKAHVDDWAKDIAPSAELRKWFAHDAAKWTEFHGRYRAELLSGKTFPAFLESIKDKPVVTLLYGAKDTAHNNAVVLADVIKENL